MKWIESFCEIFQRKFFRNVFHTIQVIQSFNRMSYSIGISISAFFTDFTFYTINQFFLKKILWFIIKVSLRFLNAIFHDYVEKEKVTYNHKIFKEKLFAFFYRVLSSYLYISDVRNFFKILDILILQAPTLIFSSLAKSS